MRKAKLNSLRKRIGAYSNHFLASKEHHFLSEIFHHLANILRNMSLVLLIQNDLYFYLTT